MSTIPDVSQVIAYENGEMELPEMVEFFSGLVRSGLAWRLQGHYGRTTVDLIEAGLLNPGGTVNEPAVAEAALYGGY